MRREKRDEILAVTSIAILHSELKRAERSIGIAKAILQLERGLMADIKRELEWRERHAQRKGGSDAG